MLSRRDRIVRSQVRTRFLVTLKTGEAFDGLLLDADAQTLVLGDAVAISERERATVDGQIYLARADVAYMQIPVIVAGAIG